MVLPFPQGSPQFLPDKPAKFKTIFFSLFFSQKWMILPHDEENPQTQCSCPIDEDERTLWGWSSLAPLWNPKNPPHKVGFTWQFWTFFVPCPHTWNNNGAIWSLVPTTQPEQLITRPHKTWWHRQIGVTVKWVPLHPRRAWSCLSDSGPQKILTPFPSQALFREPQHTCLRRHQRLARLSLSWTVGSEKWTVNEITTTKLTKWATSCSVLKPWKMFIMSPHHVKLNGPTHTFFSCVTREVTSLSLSSSACRRVSWWKWNGQWTTMTSCPKSKASDVPDQQFSERAKGSSRLQRVPTTTKIEWTHTPLLPAWHVHLFCRCLSLWRRLPAGRIVWEV